MMKKFLWMAGAAMLAGSAAVLAQHPHVAYIGLAETATGTTYSMPATTLTVDVVVKKESIRSGPYARYAQKYLGVMAPLADKDIFIMTDAVLNYSETGVPQSGGGEPSGRFGRAVPAQEAGEPRFDDRGVEPLLSERVVVSHTESDTSFVRMAPDRTVITEKSLEEMARDAANTIFTLRKKRLELITGDAGENVFGAGMQAALNEIARLENEYLSLFLGKQVIRQMVRRYTIVPDEEKTSYIVCRFSEGGGLLSDTDLSGRPILLEMRPEGRVKPATLPQRGAKDTRPGIYFRVADYVNCRLVDGKNELAAQRIPIYQFGVTIDVPRQ